MNCLAIDDEPLALNVVKEYCRKVDSINLVGTYTNALDAIPKINENNIDVIFLDVEMPNITGLEFIKTLPNPPLIIITSAHSRYAMEGFELNIVDYLLKPIVFEKFLKAINKAHLFLLTREKNEDNHIILPEKNACDYLFVKEGYSTVKICFSEIDYIEGLKDYMKICVKDKIHLTKSTIKHIESKLPPEKFIRVHKSFIVSLDKINKIENNRIFIGSQKIPIGLQYKTAFNDKIETQRL